MSAYTQKVVWKESARLTTAIAAAKTILGDVGATTACREAVTAMAYDHCRDSNLAPRLADVVALGDSSCTAWDHALTLRAMVQRQLAGSTWGLPLGQAESVAKPIAAVESVAAALDNLSLLRDLIDDVLGASIESVATLARSIERATDAQGIGEDLAVALDDLAFEPLADGAI